MGFLLLLGIERAPEAYHRSIEGAIGEMRPEQLEKKDWEVLANILVLVLACMSGYLRMAEGDLRELRGKTEGEIIALLDKKTEELRRTFAGQYVLEDRIR